MQSTTIQIQSILYENSKQSIYLAIESLANAVSTANTTEKKLEKVSLIYGDASPDPVFTQDEYEKLVRKYGNTLDISIDFFSENTGTAKGHNRIAQNCTTEYIMIMNPDVIVNPHIFEQLLSPFIAAPEVVGITEARQTPIEHHKEYNQRTGETSWASTACAMFPLSIFRQIGGFDHETFFMYCDDLDFSWRVRLSGYKIIYVPGAVVFHAKGLTPDAGWKTSEVEKYYSAEAALMLSHKWSNPKRLADLLSDYSSSDDACYNKAAQVFIEKQKNDSLPQPIDPQHTVASFTKHGYGDYRFIF